MRHEYHDYLCTWPVRIGNAVPVSELCPNCKSTAVLASDVTITFHYYQGNRLVGKDYECSNCSYGWKVRAGFIRPGTIQRGLTTPEAKKHTRDVFLDIQDELRSKFVNGILHSDQDSSRTFQDGFGDGLTEIYQYAQDRLINASKRSDLDEESVDKFWGYYKVVKEKYEAAGPYAHRNEKYSFGKFLSYQTVHDQGTMPVLHDLKP